MRLGDLDRIAQDVRDNNIENYYKQDWTSSQIVTLLENAPTIDAVPVVRCRECSKKDKNICPLVLVQFDRNMKQVLVQKPVPDDFFCSYGQRKEADHEVPEP